MNLPQLVCDIRTPKIMWHQTDLLVRVHILLVDVKEYFLRVDRERLLFSTCMKDTKYYVILNLFGAVIPEKCMNRNTGREIKIYIPKALKGIDWLRLQLEPEKNPMIVVDPERLQIPEWKKPILPKKNVMNLEDYKKRYNIMNIRPDEPSSDEGDSEDDAFDTYFD